LKFSFESFKSFSFETSLTGSECFILSLFSTTSSCFFSFSFELAFSLELSENKNYLKYQIAYNND
jgi:hypothetical protein